MVTMPSAVRTWSSVRAKSLRLALGLAAAICLLGLSACRGSAPHDAPYDASHHQRNVGELKTGQ